MKQYGTKTLKRVEKKVLEITLDKKLVAYCLVETRTKLEELFPPKIVECDLNRVQLFLVFTVVSDKRFLMVSLLLGHGGQRTSVKCAEAAWITGVIRWRHTLKINCGFFFLLRFVLYCF